MRTREMKRVRKVMLAKKMDMCKRYFAGRDLLDSLWHDADWRAAEEIRKLDAQIAVREERIREKRETK